MTNKNQSIRITDLLLYIENPRFEPVKDQKHALAVMMEKMKKKIKKLAKHIAIYGLNPGKPWYVVPNNGKYIVHEGNRRLTAIKLINDPTIIKLDKKTNAFFRNLKKNFGENIPQSVNCTVYTSGKHALPWIKLEHTGENGGAGLVKWSSEQTSRYIALVSDSKPALGALYLGFMRDNGIPGVDNIKASSLTRLVSTPIVRKKIGLYFKNRLPKCTKATKDVVSNLKKVSKAMGETNFHVGIIYKADQRIEWIRDLLTKKDSIDKATSDPAANIKNNIGEKSPEQKQPTNRQTLIPSSFQINIPHEKINSIYSELKKLKVDDFRNSVAVLFRVFLELSVVHFITTKNLTAEHPSKRKTLKSKLKRVSNYMENKKLLTKNELKAVRTAYSNKDSIFSIDTFNSYVHNLDHTPEVENLKIPWNNMEKFIQKLWE